MLTEKYYPFGLIVRVLGSKGNDVKVYAKSYLYPVFLYISTVWFTSYDINSISPSPDTLISDGLTDKFASDFVFS